MKSWEWAILRGFPEVKDQDLERKKMLWRRVMKCWIQNSSEKCMSKLPMTSFPVLFIGKNLFVLNCIEFSLIRLWRYFCINFEYIFQHQKSKSRFHWKFSPFSIFNSKENWVNGNLIEFEPPQSHRHYQYSHVICITKSKLFFSIILWQFEEKKSTFSSISNSFWENY